MRSSQAAVDLIVAEEVSSKATYIKKYQRPEWPGGASGVTVGIGYDLGYATAGRIQSDWKNFLTPDVILAMQRCAGVTGANARNLLASVRPKILVPWEAAMSVFINVDMPKWEALVLKAVPGSDKLPPDCIGVLTSLAYNRGASFSKAGDRYREMRDIRAHVASGEWDKIPGDFKSMKRIWPDVAGLRGRRDREAALFQKGLAASSLHSTDFSSSNRVASGDDRTLDTDSTPEVTSTGNEVLNVQPVTMGYNVEVEIIQKQLIAMNYHEVGDVDGVAGGKFVAGVASFMTDRGKDPNKGKLTPELKSEVSAARSENWSRPIAPARANATAKDIAPKVESVNQTWYTKLWAYVMGIPAAAIAFFKSIFGDYNDPTSYIYQVKSFFGAVPVEYYAVVVAGIAGLILWQATKSQNATVNAYNEGKIN